MPQENVDLVMELHDAFSRGDLDGLLSKWDPECEYRAAMTQVVEGEGGVFRGHDGLRRWWNDLREFYDDLNTEVLEARDLGAQVLVVFLIRGRAKGSGIYLADGDELAQVSTVREGKVTEARDYFSRDEALEAVGLAD